jgi:hypothetical protein
MKGKQSVDQSRSHYGVQATAASVRSCLAPAARSS